MSAEDWHVTWSVYRFYSAQGVLLYVGYTRRFALRIGEHRRGKPWWPEVSSIEADHFPTEDQARVREKEIWASEKPLYNKVSPFSTDEEEREKVRRKRLNASPETKERWNARRRVVNMSPEAIERERERARIKGRKRDRRVLNLSPEERERERERGRKRSALGKKRIRTQQSGPGLF